MLARIEVIPSWIDYNGHMTESRYLEACGQVTDALLERVGAGPANIAGGQSFFTAETHLVHLGECRLGDWLEGAVRILEVLPRRLHVFVTLDCEGRPVATVEQMLISVDLGTRRSAPAAEPLLGALLAIAASQAHLPRPAAAGRFVGAPRPG